MQRYGMTIPMGGVPLAEQRDWVVEMQELGYTDFWSSEADSSDGFTPCVLAGEWAPSCRVGSAIIPAFTRGPAVMAQTVATVADALPGRFVFGIGTSSDVIVERWNDIPFERPYYRTRDMVRFVKQALTGEKVTAKFDTFEVNGFRASLVPKVQPKIMIAALRQGMLKLAGRESDGAILNWLSPDDVKKVAPHVHDAGPDKELIARIFVIPTDDTEQARSMAKRMICAYLNVPVYKAFHQWLGNSPKLQQCWDLWAEGDRKGALASVPDELADELYIYGTPAECRAGVQRYIDAGITTPVLAVTPMRDYREVTRELAPRPAR